MNKVWQFRYDSLNDVASLVLAGMHENSADMFYNGGTPRNWATRPRLTVFVEPRRKKPRPRVDMSTLDTGSFVLNEKAKTALGDFLLQFGELPEVDCDGVVEYYYNVLNMVDCVDPDQSKWFTANVIERPAFLGDKVPSQPALFKCPETRGTAIYANDAAKKILSKLIRQHEITGAGFFKPGVLL